MWCRRHRLRNMLIKKLFDHCFHFSWFRFRLQQWIMYGISWLSWNDAIDVLKSISVEIMCTRSKSLQSIWCRFEGKKNTLKCEIVIQSSGYWRLFSTTFRIFSDICLKKKSHLWPWTLQANFFLVVICLMDGAEVNSKNISFLKIRAHQSTSMDEAENHS